MSKIQCEVTNCASNREECCCRNGISVEGEEACCCDETCCCSFQPKMGGYDNMVCAEGPSSDTRIYCEAEKCAYNEGGNCTAEQINMAGDGADHSRETCCDTFRER